MCIWYCCQTTGISSLEQSCRSVPSRSFSTLHWNHHIRQLDNYSSKEYHHTSQNIFSQKLAGLLTPNVSLCFTHRTQICQCLLPHCIQINGTCFKNLVPNCIKYQLCFLVKYFTHKCKNSAAYWENNMLFFFFVFWNSLCKS